MYFVTRGSATPMAATTSASETMPINDRTCGARKVEDRRRSGQTFFGAAEASRMSRSFERPAPIGFAWAERRGRLSALRGRPRPAEPPSEEPRHLRGVSARPEDE